MGLGYLLDTNVVIDSLSDSISDNGKRLLLSNHFHISAITHIELMSQTGMSADDRRSRDAFIGKCTSVFDRLNFSLVEVASRLRREYGLKLPDAVIAATALINDLTLVTSDIQFQHVRGLSVLNHRMV